MYKKKTTYTVHNFYVETLKQGKPRGNIFSLQTEVQEKDYKSLKIRESPLRVLANSTHYAYSHFLSSPYFSLLLSFSTQLFYTILEVFLYLYIKFSLAPHIYIRNKLLLYYKKQQLIDRLVDSTIRPTSRQSSQFNQPAPLSAIQLVRLADFVIDHLVSLTSWPSLSLGSSIQYS